ncbi:DDB1- and CUL4-associated factor 11 isoform X2 [Eurytemora carolleeae]|nr:DDB1- and CUL4-associated factor 11 isoform X2 [Eurytemora carolleeae]|eukprot:XP_023342562.1 DDB1- and CUL4-associated factor 11-like isoform X2 [Eurytemora affinis]
METSLRSIIRALTGGASTISFAASDDDDRNVLSISDETDDSDSAGSGELPYSYRPVPTMHPSSIDTSYIVQNEISVTSCFSEQPLKDCNIHKFLQDRALGIRKPQSVKRLNSTLLPDTETKVAAFKNKVFCGVHGREGDIFLSACQDKQLRVFDTSRGNFKLLQTIPARDVGWSILDVALNPTGTHLVYSSWNDYLYQVHILGDNYSEDGYSVEQIPLCLDPPTHNQFCIFSVRFSQDSSELLGGANDGCLYLYDRESHSQRMTIQAHDSDVNAVCFVDETTQILASGGDDGLCRVWDRRSLRESNPQPVGTLAGHRDGIAYVDPRGDGRYIITNSKDQSIKLWDIRKFSRESDVEEGRRAVSKNMQWDYRWERPKGGLARLKGDSSIMSYTGHSVLQTLIRCHFSPEHSTGQRYIYTGCASGRVVIYDVLTGEIVQTLSGHRACVRDVSWHPYYPEILSSSWDFSINKWEHAGVAKEEVEELSKLKEPPPKKKRKKICRISGLGREQLLDLFTD